MLFVGKKYASMPNDCVMGCRGQETTESGNKDSASGTSTTTPPASKPLSVFHFPIKRHSHLLPYWERFVNRGVGWHAKPNTVLCSSHFKTDYLKESDKRTHLDWKKNPVPTVYVDESSKKYPSCDHAKSTS